MKKNFVILAINFILSNTLTAQSNIPTFKAQLRLSNADSSQLYYNLGKEYSDVNVDSCLYFLQAALAVAERRNNALGIAQAMNRIGYTYTIYKRDDGKAVEWLNKAIAIGKKTNDNLNLARSYQYLGIIAHYQKSNTADELLARALTYAKASKDWEVLTSNYDIISTRYLKFKKFKESGIALLNAMDACEAHSPDDWLSYGLDYAERLVAQNKKEEADVFCQKLASVKGKLKKTKGEFVYLMDLARLESRLKNFALADSLCHNALTIEKAKTHPDTFHLTFIYRQLLDVNILKGNAELAHQAIEDFIDIRLAKRESRLTQDSKVKMTELNSALELEKKEIEIALLDEQKKRQRLFMIGTVIIAVLLGGFMLVLERNKRRIEQQKTALTALNATKDKLFAILSHDLMSPIATLKNYTMLVDWGAMSQAEFVESSHSLKTEVNNLYTMLENLLHWSITQMKGIKPKFEKVNVADVLNEQIALLAPIAKGKSIEIVQNITDTTIDVDRNHLALIVRNLLQNALKFTNKGGCISFDNEAIPPLGAEGTEGGKKLSISDNGVGMSAEVVSQLFQIEHDTHQKGTDKEGGTGLGLILTKELVELNGGTINVESEVDRGTVFSLAFEK